MSRACYRCGRKGDGVVAHDVPHCAECLERWCPEARRRILDRAAAYHRPAYSPVVSDEPPPATEPSPALPRPATLGYPGWVSGFVAGED